MPSEWTTIRISKTTAKRLKALGRMGESYEDVISRLIDEHEKMEKARLVNAVSAKL